MVRKRNNPGRNYFFVIIVFISLFSGLQIAVPSVAGLTDFIGKYEVTMYLDVAFTGTTELSRSETSDTLTTYFGAYFGGTLSTRTDITLSHSTNGYLEIKDYSAFYDQDGYLRKTKSTWSVHVTGYQQSSWTSEYEYGNYEVLQNNETVYEETYTQRYYEDGVFSESVECRDVLTLDGMENLTISAETFECARLKITFYEDDVYTGYVHTWITENGMMVQQKQYDENGDLYFLMVLIPGEGPSTGVTSTVSTTVSSPGPESRLMFDNLFLGMVLMLAIAGGVSVFIFIYWMRKRQPSRDHYRYRAYGGEEPHGEYRPREEYHTGRSIPAFCGECGKPVEPGGNFCSNCGAKIR